MPFCNRMFSSTGFHLHNHSGEFIAGVKYVKQDSITVTVTATRNETSSKTRVSDLMCCSIICMSIRASVCLSLLQG